MSTPGLLDHFSALEDPRQRWKTLYPLNEVLLIMLGGVMAGADDFVEMSLWGKRKLAWLRRFPDLAAIGMVESIVENKGQVSVARRYFRHRPPCLPLLCFRPAAATGALRTACTGLDAVFHDGLMRLRANHGTANIALIRHAALNLFKNTKGKISLKNQR